MSRLLRSRLLSTPLRPTFHSPLNPRLLQIRLLTDEARAAIDTAVKQKPVVLFMKGTPSAPQCGFSRATVQILGLQGVDPSKFASYNVLEDSELRSGIKEYSEWPTVPQLYVNGEFVGGCDIVMNMHQSGELEKILENAGVLVPIEEEEDAAVGKGMPSGEVVVGQEAIDEIDVIHGEEKGGKKQDVGKDLT